MLIVALLIFIEHIHGRQPATKLWFSDILKSSRYFRQGAIYGISSMGHYQHPEVLCELFPSKTFCFICRLTFALWANSGIVVFHWKPVSPEAMTAPGAHRFIFLFVIYDIGFLDHIIMIQFLTPAGAGGRLKHFSSISLCSPPTADPEHSSVHAFLPC